MAKTADIRKIQENIEALRNGPRPLPLHIGTAISEYAKKNAADSSHMMAEMTAMVAGIRKYQEHPFRRSMPPLPVVWQQGEVSLLYCAAEGEKKGSSPAIFLIPSMINKSTILDLLPHRSFVRWLAGQGFDVYLLDWGSPVEDPALVAMDGVIGKRLLPAMAFLRQETGAPYHALGYCMGGVLLAAAATLFNGARHSTRHGTTLRSTVFLASPWDFHAGNRTLSDHVRTGTASALQMMEKNDVLPVNWVQSVFIAVNADRTVKKFSDFLEIDPDSEKAHLFVAVEDWLNDGLDLPCSVARTCIMEWYNENRPGKGTWKVMGNTINPADIRTPSLVVASSHDRLVPSESSLSMAKMLPQGDILNPDTGHIGMLSGKKAKQDVWIPVAEWLRAR